MTEPTESWKSDKRVRFLLQRNMEEGESIRFAIEGMDGQCIIALDERLLVVKPGSATDTTYSGLATSIAYRDISTIKVRKDSSNRVVEIHTSDYQVTEAHTGEGPPETNFFLSDDPNSIPIAKWSFNKQKSQLLKLSELIRETREAPYNIRANSISERSRRE